MKTGSSLIIEQTLFSKVVHCCLISSCTVRSAEKIEGSSASEKRTRLSQNAASVNLANATAAAKMSGRAASDDTKFSVVKFFTALVQELEGSDSSDRLEPLYCLEDL
jgi:hypothetical protein